MKIIPVLALFVSSFAMAQEAEAPKDLKDPATVIAPATPNLHDVEVKYPRSEGPIIEKKKDALPYQTACRNGDISRCSGVDLSTFESTIRVRKSESMLPKISKPALVNIRPVGESEERPTSPKRRPKRR